MWKNGPGFMGSLDLALGNMVEQSKHRYDKIYPSCKFMLV
jgi:hypothetical protein